LRPPDALGVEDDVALGTIVESGNMRSFGLSLAGFYLAVSRRCFITVVSNLLITNDLIFECFLGHTFGHTFSASTPKSLKTLGNRGD
jgi:hypothetical protein